MTDNIYLPYTNRRNDMNVDANTCTTVISTNGSAINPKIDFNAIKQHQKATWA